MLTHISESDVIFYVWVPERVPSHLLLLNNKRMEIPLEPIVFKSLLAAPFASSG